MVAARLDDAATPVGSSDGEPLIRTRTMTMLVWAPDADAAEGAAAVMIDLAAHHPGRAIIVVARCPSRLVVGLSARPGLEVVRLDVGGALPLAEQTRPLWLRGLPCVTWWLGTPPSRVQAHGLPGLLILDSASCPSPTRGLQSILDLVDGGRPVVDLNWERLAPWRSFVGCWLAPADAEPYRQGIASVLIEHGLGTTAAAHLLGGWLATRQLGLGPSPTGRLAPRRSDAPGGPKDADQAGPAVYVTPRAGAGDADLSITLHVGNGRDEARFAAERQADCAIGCRTTLSGGRHTAWRFPVAEPPLTDLLGQCLDDTATDLELARALRHGGGGGQPDDAGHQRRE